MNKKLDNTNCIKCNTSLYEFEKARDDEYAGLCTGCYLSKRRTECFKRKFDL